MEQLRRWAPGEQRAGLRFGRHKHLEQQHSGLLRSRVLRGWLLGRQSVAGAAGRCNLAAMCPLYGMSSAQHGASSLPRCSAPNCGMVAPAPRVRGGNGAAERPALIGARGAARHSLSAAGRQNFGFRALPLRPAGLARGRALGGPAARSSVLTSGPAAARLPIPLPLRALVIARLSCDQTRSQALVR